MESFINTYVFIDTPSALPDSTTGSASPGHMTQAMNRIDSLISKMESFKQMPNPKKSEEEEGQKSDDKEDDCACPNESDEKSKSKMAL